MIILIAERRNNMNRKIEIKYRDGITNWEDKNGAIHGNLNKDNFKALLKMDNLIVNLSKDELKIFLYKDDMVYDYINEEYRSVIFNYAKNFIVQKSLAEFFDWEDLKGVWFEINEPEPINSRIDRIIDKLNDIKNGGWNRADTSLVMNEILYMLR
jgi:hypothetical protein